MVVAIVLLHYWYLLHYLEITTLLGSTVGVLKVLYSFGSKFLFNFSPHDSVYLAPLNC